MDLAASFNSLSVNSIPPDVSNFAAIINGTHTEFVITKFPNYKHLIVTQFGKIGNIYQVKIDQPENGFSISDPVYTITTILGGENIEAEVAVRYLSEKLNIRKTILICLTLKEYSRDTLKQIVKAIQNYKPQ